MQNVNTENGGMTVEYVLHSTSVGTIRSVDFAMCAIQDCIGKYGLGSIRAQKSSINTT